MEKEFVSYEQAVKLKELGFDEECMGCYFVDTNSLLIRSPMARINRTDNLVIAPLKQQAFRWLYQKTNKWIIPIPNDDKIGEWFGYGVSYSSFEKAEDACIDKLIELAKQK